MALLEYKGYVISVTATEQTWGFSFGEWGGTYRVWHKENLTPIEGVIEGCETSAFEAEQRTLRIVKVAIDEATSKTSEQLMQSLSQLGERFAI